LPPLHSACGGTS